jgi:hypothetical protein
VRLEDSVCLFSLYNSELDIPGGFTGGATPLPIPNRVVKPSRADGTVLATAWESRSPPGFLSRGRGVTQGEGNGTAKFCLTATGGAYRITSSGEAGCFRNLVSDGYSMVAVPKGPLLTSTSQLGLEALNHKISKREEVSDNEE